MARGARATPPAWRTSTATSRTRWPRRWRFCKSWRAAKFDESVDIAMSLGVDPKHADQMVRGAVVLPHGTGKIGARPGVRQGRQGEGGARPPAPTSSAPTIWSKKITDEGWLDFDARDRDARHDGPGRPARSRARSARPDAEPEGRHRHRGRRRRAVSREQGRQGRVPRREGGHRALSDRQGVVRARSICATTRRALIDAIVRAKPASAKGTYLKKISLSTTMGPGIRIDPGTVVQAAA